MRMRNVLLLMCALLLLLPGVQAQVKKTVTGVVRDQTGAALSGATVSEKNTRNSAVTDVNGAFSISVADNATLVISFAGFTAQEVSAAGSTSFNVNLEPNNTTLNEVVVTGFGVRRQTKKLSYSVQEVKAEELARANTPSLVNALQGKVAGVMINQGAGGPSSSSRIRVRGNASITSSNTQPLFVVDGVLIKPSTSGADSWGDARDFGNEIKNLNPDDYESVTVLKGSAATALYGSDALNGVVLITTKKGRVRKGLGVSVAHSSTFEKAYKLPDFQNEYGGGFDGAFVVGAGGVNEVEPTLGPYYSFGPKFDGSMVKDVDGRMIPWRANNLLDIFRTGQFYNTNVAMEGGSERTSFRFSYTNTKNNSVMPNNSFGRNVFTLRATQKLNKAINLDATITYTTSKSKNPLLQGGNSNPLFRFAYSNSRHYDIPYYSNLYIDTVRGGRVGASGNPTTIPYLRGSMTSVYWNFYQKNITQQENNLRANLDINVEILPWLNLLVRGNINSTSTVRENEERGELPGFLGGYYALYQSNARYARLQSLLTANRSFGTDFEGSLSVGGETNRGLDGYISSANTNGGFKVADIYALSNSVNTISANGSEQPQTRLDAVYAYGDLTWKERLTLNFSGRNDWNSTLTYASGAGDYSYFYPSVGLAYIFTENLKNNPSFDFLSFGKLRASLGYVGSGPDIFATSRGFGYALLGNYTNWNGSVIPQYGISDYTLGNFNLKPQRAREIEFGADLRFFDNRIGIDASWYKKNTFNQIISLSTPAESGTGGRLINAGNIQNKGIEILLTANPVRSRDWNWNTTFNFSRNRNKIIDLDKANGVTSIDLDLAFGADVRSVARVGKDYGTIVTNYAFATYQKKDANGNPIAHASNGQKLLKQNGLYWRSGDAGQGAKELGTMMEDFLLSNSNEVRFKDFSLFVQVDSKIGGLMASATHQYGSQYGSFESTLFGRDAAHGGVAYTDANGVQRNDGIIPEGVFSDGTIISGIDVSGMTYNEAVSKALVKPLSAATYYDGIASWGTGIREYSVFENSWVAVREMSIGYNVPKRFSDKLRMNTLRISAVGRNLFYLYNTAKDNINPEGIFSSRAGTFAEYGGVPYIRSIGVSLNAGF